MLKLNLKKRFITKSNAIVCIIEPSDAVDTGEDYFFAYDKAYGVSKLFPGDVQNEKLGKHIAESRAIAMNARDVYRCLEKCKKDTLKSLDMLEKDMAQMKNIYNAEAARDFNKTRHMILQPKK